MQTTVRHKAELEGDSLRHIQPVQFDMEESRQTMIKFLRVADYSSGGVEHSLQLVYRSMYIRKNLKTFEQLNLQIINLHPY